MTLKKSIIIPHIKNKNRLLIIWEEWGISDLCGKISPIDSEKYLMIFNYSEFENRVKEWYKIIKSRIWRDFIEWLNNMMHEKLILYTKF